MTRIRAIVGFLLLVSLPGCAYEDEHDTPLHDDPHITTPPPPGLDANPGRADPVRPTPAPGS